MSRRERTTGLPRPKPRARATSGWRIAGITWQEHHIRWGILGASLLALVFVVGWLGYDKYDERFVQPNHVVLTVGSQKYRLNYYADRLYQFALANQQQQTGTNVGLLEQQLLTKLEDEALTIALAKEKQIDLSDDEITRQIAAELGVPVGGTGSSFDTLYRQRLKTTKMSDSNYRKLAEANLADARLLEAFKKELGDTGEGITLRAVLTATKEDADKVVERIKGGEDMGTVSQTTSLELESKQNDGIMLPEPAELLPEAIRNAIKDKPAGTELFGPIQVQDNWWVFRIEKRDPEYAYSDSQKAQLAQARLDAAIEEKRSALKPKRNLTTDDITWAEKNAG